LLHAKFYWAKIQKYFTFAFMYLVKTPILISKLMSKSLIWNIPDPGKKIYLTFDDGPIPHLTMEILSILADYNAKATFFCVGENAEKYVELMSRMADDGHLIGNHSHQHLSGWKSKTSEYVNNVRLANKYINSKLFRPPYGQITYQQIQALKNEFKIVMWSVLSGDFDKNLSAEECLFNVLQCKEGDIVVFHDNYKAEEKVLEVLPQFLNYYTQRGYSFEHLGNLLND
jgi:peptidoglycan/xylan/chitin deacetylase (PgdA/CDA1 family)